MTLAADASLYNAGLTSHPGVNVMLALEDEFDLEFPSGFSSGRRSSSRVKCAR
jgi:hypothetical protein